jgi:hypothetical protein
MNRFGDTLIHTGSNEELVRAFVSGDVEFVVIGGLAVAWHCPDRQADDMDLLVNPTSENSKRIARILNSLGLQGHNEGTFMKLGVQAPLKERHYAELLTPRLDGPSYSEVAGDSATASLFTVPVRVASIASLIKLKQHAVASLETEVGKHMGDIKRLKEHLPQFSAKFK